jgi:hypothetical protein
MLQKLRILQKYGQSYIVITDKIPAAVVAPLYDPGLKSYYEYLATGKKTLWIVSVWKSWINIVKDHWHEIV